MKNRLRFGFLSLLLVLCLACDPNEAELKCGQSLDIERMTGTVTAKAVCYFQGDNEYTKKDQGKPFYCLTIQHDGTTDEFKGVLPNVFDAVEVGTILPRNPVLTLKHLQAMSGTVVDLKSDLSQQKWFVAIKDAEVIKVFQVERDVYYKYINVGMQLPLRTGSIPGVG